ncbi:MarR family winged helix-turn-helix transcriptional regulator [Massilia rubra]|nr:MarR family winged helix-turn-helix transcriptional regulator [Massilia rubra]
MTDTTDKPLGCTCFKLRKLTRAMSRVYDQHMAAVGLKTTQYSVLANVARAALPVAELAERLGMERTTLTRNLKPLTDAGWVAARPGADSRQRIVTITDAGQEKLGQAYLAWCDAQRAFEQLVGRDAVRALHTQLDTTLARLTPLIENLNHAHPD